MKRLTILAGISTLVAVVVLGAIFLLGSSFSSVNAQTDDGETAVSNRTIQVDGLGRISAQPDVAIVQLGVTTEAISATAALEENSLRMNDLISVTQEAGIAEEDIRTLGLSIQPIFSNSDSVDGETTTITGYRARNIVEITTTDLEGIGTLLDDVISAGGNTIEGIRFELSDNSALLDAAREAAVDDARNKAEQLATLLDAELGEVQTVIAYGGSVPAPVAFDEAAFDGGSGLTAVSISPGTQTIEASIQVTWTLE